MVEGFAAAPIGGTPRARRIWAALAAVIGPTGTGLVVLGQPWRAAAWMLAITIAFGSVPWFPRVGVAATFLIGFAAFADTFVAEDRSQRFSWFRVVAVLVPFAAGSFVVRLLERAYVTEPFRMPTSGMAPGLIRGDHFFVDRRPGVTPRRGGIFVFEAGTEDKPVDFVQRVVALAGDTIAVHGGTVMVNGENAAPESRPCESHPEERNCLGFIETLNGAWQPYLVEYVAHGNDPDYPNGTCPPPMEQLGDACRVPAGHVFMLGDNRGDSYDSRFRGPVPVTTLKGRALVIDLSYADGVIRWSRIGKLLGPTAWGD